MPDSAESYALMSVLFFPARLDYPTGGGWSKSVACAGAGSAADALGQADRSAPDD